MTGVAVATWRLKLRDSVWLVLLELILVSGIFAADRYKLIFFSKTLYLLALAAASLWMRGLRLHDIGLHFDSGWQRLVLIGVGAGFAMEALELFVTQPLLVLLTGKYPDLSLFRDLIGNWRLLLIGLCFIWILAALGEEVVWRGYLMNRVADLFGRSAKAWALSLVLVNIAFGYAHAYQDFTGIAENILDGVLLGLLYLGFGGSLVVPIMAHGVTDTLDALLVFSRHYPGM